ncbi:MAG: putative porin [Muribaculaceae bacterium]|nr:putative porin [Muribaculaceae bacterium]MBQ2563798.1 putative porin [Muribaculaceae bacterium]
MKVEPSYAWSISEPLGLHYESTIDTLFLNYHKSFIPSHQSTAWATTGNFGASGQNQIFFQRKPTSDFFFQDAIDSWLPGVATQRYYNTRIPMTIISHNTGGNKYSNQDRTQVLFSGNVDKKLQLGGAIDYIYSKGSYNYQADKNFRWSLFGSYIGDRYEMQTFFNSYNYLGKENGGITDDQYITDPAKVQGGETKVDNKSIPTYLTAAHSKMTGLEFYLNQSYNVGHYKYQRDSVTDTIIGRTYIPVTRFIWTADFKTSKHLFLNQNAAQDQSFFENSYLSLTGTDETTRYWRLRNTLGVSLLEGFNKYAKFGFSVYATHEMRRYKQVVDTVSGKELPEGLVELPVTIDPTKTQQLLWVGGQLTKQRGSILTYAATAQFGLLGDVSGDIDIEGSVTTRFKLFGDTVSLKAYGYFKNLEAPYLLKQFVSNHYAWDNKFSKVQRFRAGGILDLPWIYTSINVGYETLNNYIYFNNNSLPEQSSSAVHVLNASLTNHLGFGIFNWDNEVTYQTSSNASVLPLPKFSIFSNMYLKFRIARVLDVQVGVDCNYYTKYYAPAYNPAIMSFYNQSEIECGNFAFADVYANFKLKKARFYVMYSHANKGLFGGNNYFSIPHYPLNPGRFQLGISVDFVN